MQVQCLSFDEYQAQVTAIKKYASNPNLYLISKLTEETGEVAKEFIRREDGLDNSKDLKSELGDILWCIASIAEHNGIKMSEVVDSNIEKLKGRNLLAE